MKGRAEGGFVENFKDGGRERLRQAEKAAKKFDGDRHAKCQHGFGKDTAKGS
jgi:hypothetical protein